MATEAAQSTSPKTARKGGVDKLVGAPATVREAIGRFVERTRADEIVVSGAAYDPAARERSLELTVEALAG